MVERRCKRIFAALSEYLDGELPAPNCRELERHLKGCKPCLAYLETLKATTEACRRLPAGKAPRPSARVRAALVRAAQKVPGKRESRGSDRELRRGRFEAEERLK